MYGDSYGTYFAQAFAVRHPVKTRAIVLDGAFSLGGFDPWERNESPICARPGRRCARGGATAPASSPRSPAGRRARREAAQWGRARRRRRRPPRPGKRRRAGPDDGRCQLELHHLPRSGRGRARVHWRAPRAASAARRRGSRRVRQRRAAVVLGGRAAGRRLSRLPHHLEPVGQDLRPAARRSPAARAGLAPNVFAPFTKATGCSPSTSTSWCTGACCGRARRSLIRRCRSARGFPRCRCW